MTKYRIRLVVLGVLLLMIAAWASADANLLQAPASGGTINGTINLNNVNNSAAIVVMGL